MEKTTLCTNCLGFFPVVGEAETYQVPVVSTYLHLGSLIHHSGATKEEAKRRIAIANACFNRHRRLVFQNQQLPLDKRIELFQCLVMSKLSYAGNMDTPGLADKGVRACSHHASLPTPPEGCPR